MQTHHPPAPVELQGPATPDGIAPEAWAAFARMTHDCGPDLFRLPNSCEIYLSSYLAAFPAEHNLLFAALRLDIPARIIEASTRPGFDEFLAQCGNELAAAAGVGAAEAGWAVEAWARAVERPPGYLPPAASPQVDPPATLRMSEAAVQRLMRVIVGAGGGLGALLGWGILMLVFLAFTLVDVKFGVKKPAGPQLAEFFWILGGMLGGAAAAACGAVAGWVQGRGNEHPWAGFSAAFGAAFVSAAYAAFRIGPNVFAVILLILSTFGATYTSASRGGYKTYV